MNNKNEPARRRPWSMAPLVAGLLWVSPGWGQVLDEDTTAYLDRIFVEGMEALQEERFRTAIEAFNTILSQDPSLHRARLELALAYYRSFRYEEAERYARQVLADPETPDNVRVTIAAFLAQVRKDARRAGERHFKELELTLGYMHDSNVAAGPADELIELGDVTLTLGPDSQEEADSATVLNGNVRHTYNPNKVLALGERYSSFLWQTTAAVYHRDYWEEQDFDLSIFTLSTGPALVTPRFWRGSLQFNFDYLELGGEDLAYFYTARPFMTWQFGLTELMLDATYTRRIYDNEDDRGREGDYFSGGFTLGRFFLQRKLALQGGAQLVDFSADDDQFGYDGYDLYLGASFQAWVGGNVFARANYRKSDYDDDAVFFVDTTPVATEPRDEDEWRLSAGFQHRFSKSFMKKWRLEGWVEHTDNQSNIEVYDYNRTQISLQLSRSFF